MSILLTSKDEKITFEMREVLKGWNSVESLNCELVESLVNMMSELSEIPEAQEILKKYGVNFTIREV